jgi:hypothetical protein
MPPITGYPIIDLLITLAIVALVIWVVVYFIRRLP